MKEAMKLVPVEPTQKMLDAPPNAYPADALVTWKAMLAAAPQPAPVQQEPAWRTAGGIPRFKQAQRKPLTDWIDPNDKTQKQYLPHIGEPVLFCHGGKTYIGKHNGGSFQTEVDYANYFNTWECHWMRLPAAHNIKEQP